MNLILMNQDGIDFGFDIPVEVDNLLQQAIQSYHDTERAERTLWHAYEIAPECLGTYIALYKFYCTKRQMEQAEQVALIGLDEAASQGGFIPDWRRLAADSTDWSGSTSPQRFFLYTLKALAFIRLRIGKIENARAILAKLAELDPGDQVGSSVIADLALGVAEAGHG